MTTLATIGELTISAVTSESHGLTTTVTEHPIEEGGDVADNVQRKGDTLRLEGLITAESPSDVRAKLERYLNEREPLVVSTYRRRYDNMVLISLDLPDEVRLGRAVKFSASFKQVRFVQTRTTAIRSPKRTSTPGSKEKEDGNKKVGAPASEAVVRRSTAHKGVGAASDLVNRGIQKFVEGN